jgi:hypothetical protein
MRRRTFVIMLLLIVWAFPVLARGGGHRSSGSSSGPKSTYVHGYTRKDGTYVAPHTRSAPGTVSSKTTSSTSGTIHIDGGYTGTDGSYVAPHLHRSAPRSGSSTYTLPRRSSTSTPTTTYSGSTSTIQRDSHGRIKRSESAKHSFMKRTGYSHGRPGYVVDHVKPLCRGGLDAPSNMQWQTVAAAKVKDRTECH